MIDLATPKKARIQVLDGVTNIRLDYDDFMRDCDIQPSNDYNRDMPTALVRAIPDPVHGYRVYLIFHGQDSYFACYEWDATTCRWGLESTNFEAPLISLQEAYKELVSRIEACIKQIDMYRDGNSRSFIELKKIVSKIVDDDLERPEAEGEGNDGFQTYQELSRLHEEAYFSPE
jgi:hypothetical protein